MNHDRPPLTEAEHVAWAEAKARQMADRFTVLLPQELRDAGMHFEYASIPQRRLTPGPGRTRREP